MEAPHTLQEAVVYFSDPDRAFQYALNLRWPNGVVACPRCGSEKHSFIKTRRIWFCSGCKKQFTLKVGTIFEDSPLGLDKWMCAYWMLCNCKNGVSSCELARSIGVTQKSAWHMLHRIRKTLHEESAIMLSGEVEADETFIGGKARNMHLSKKARRITGTGTVETAVMGILERGGTVRTSVVADRKKKTLQAEVKKHVEAGAALYTDALLSYEGLAGKYAHGINGTYVSIEPFHLFRYLDEQSFRCNNRKDIGDQGRFELAMGNVAGKRLTYAELTGAGSATSHS
jgi:transposase-like protein